MLKMKNYWRASLIAMALACTAASASISSLAEAHAHAASQPEAQVVAAPTPAAAAVAVDVQAKVKANAPATAPSKAVDWGRWSVFDQNEPAPALLAEPGLRLASPVSAPDPAPPEPVTALAKLT